MAKKQRSQKLNIARNLPPLYHKMPGQEYDVKNSEVTKWLIQRPSILEFIWDQLKQSGDILYDPDTGKWKGADYDD